jgi:hypothetical protein
MLKTVSSSLGSFGKSAGLRRLQSRLCRAQIPVFLVVSLTQWRVSRQHFLQQCHNDLGDGLLAVRSDAASEDQLSSSQAGRFRSLLNVQAHQLEAAIEDVFLSLPGLPDDQVMVQHMVGEVAAAGVASTHRIHDGAPWYCIEISDADSASVTAGRSTGRLHAILRDVVDQPEALQRLGAGVRQALDLLREIELIHLGQPLEIEFALGSPARDAVEPIAHLLQVRPIVQSPWRWQPASVALPDMGFLLEPDPCPEVAGPQTVLSLMSDWNPAELLGAHPRPLAMSLFQHLISDGVWWQAREELGYASAPVAGISLLHAWLGRPMVDVRRSANSLLPAGLAPELRTRLVQHFIASLQARPELHDKVEFEVYRTIRDLTRRSDLANQWTDVLGAKAWGRWEDALGQLARRLSSTAAGSLFNRHWERICQLSVAPPNLLDWRARLQRSRQGSHSFAALARLAFMGEAQLRSAVQRGALAPDRALLMKAAARQSFTGSALPGMATLGAFLRPSSFDITQLPVPVSLRMPESAADVEVGAFLLSKDEDRALTQLLREAELPLTAPGWVEFVQATASAREWAKHVFTADLSVALELIAVEFQVSGLDRDAASWLGLEQLMASPAGPQQRRSLWETWAQEARALHAGQALQMVSPVLWHPTQRHVVDSFSTLPNFVGRQVAKGHLVIEPQADHPAAELQHAIVLLRQADPGFDWLFNHPIAGLITVWGGANSHMAIRCAERGLAAAIGCGEHVLVKAHKAHRATIDPAGGGLWLS